MANTLRGRVRKVSLEFMGEEWSEAFVEFRYLTWGDSQAEKKRNEAQTDNPDAYFEAALTTIQGAFISGRSLNTDNELIDLSAKDLGSFDIEAVLTLYRRVLGVPDPNA